MSEQETRETLIHLLEAYHALTSREDWNKQALLVDLKEGRDLKEVFTEMERMRRDPGISSNLKVFLMQLMSLTARAMEKAEQGHDFR